MTFRLFSEQSRHYFDRPHSAIPSTALISEANWRGPELIHESDQWSYRLLNQDISEIEHALSVVQKTGLHIQELSRDNFRLPDLVAKIQRWKKTVTGGPGFILIQGLPVDRWSEEESSLVFWGIGHHIGLPGAQNPDNELLGHVVDYSEERTNPLVRRYRTAGNIDFHCDAADIVGLLCLHPAKYGGQSRIASSVAIFNHILLHRPDLISRLFDSFMIDRRGEENENERGFFKRPACRFDGDNLRTFYHSEYFRSAARFMENGHLDQITTELLDMYDACAASADFHLDMNLQQGDMQFISNHTIVHARTGYQDYKQRSRKRHLLRLWLSLE